MGEENASTDTGIQDYLKATVSRAQLLSAVGAGLALAAVPGAAAAAGTIGTGSAQQLSFPFFPQVQGTYTPENLQDILNLLDTFEMFLVTTNAYALVDLGSQLKDPALSFRQSRLAIGQYHLDFLQSLGARPLLTTFTPRNGVKPSTPIGNQEGDFALMVGVYTTAVREFAELGQPLLAKNASQALGTWAELRAVVRVLAASASGSAASTPPLNKAFETDHYVYLRDYYRNAVEGLQFENTGVSLSGLRLTYPGRDAVLAAAGPMGTSMLQKTPNNAIVSTSSASAPQVVTGERGDSA
jgi:hypothetical protein